jgi:PHD/YefM family antitoxin component YafN of YafNO toxin-antitoxin module
MTITANELKTKGVSIIDALLKDESEAIITVRGEQKYVVLDMERYNFLRECELEAALKEARQELKDGRFVVESVDEHMKRITDELY